jgi:Glycosyltransferase family 87
MLNGFFKPRIKLLQACALFVLALSAVLVRTRALPNLAGVRVSMPWLMGDFKIVNYCPAYLLLHGGNPYDPRAFLAVCAMHEGLPLYLPFGFLLHAPFALVPLQASSAIYFALSLVLTLVLAFAAYRLFDLPTSTSGVILVAALLMLSRPGQWNLLLGQVTLELVLATYVALFYARRSPLLSGMGLALATYKPNFGVPLLILMALRGDKRAVAAGAAIAAMVNLPLLIVLASRAGGVGALARGALVGHSEWAALFDPTAPSAGSAVDLAGFLDQVAGQRLSSVAQGVVTLLVLGIAAAALRRIGPATQGPTARLSSSIICLATLVAVHHHAYDLLLLIGPVVVLRKNGLPPGMMSRRLDLVLFALFILLGANYFGSVSVLSRLGGNRPLWLAVASLNELALLAIFCLYVFRSLALAADRRAISALG